MFKRPRLSAQSFPVNAGLAGFLLFYAASCSGPQEPAESPSDPAASDVTEEAPQQEAARETLPAVWMTRELDFPIRSIGMAGGAGSTFAVAYEGGGLQVFDFNGDRITEISDHDVQALAEGRYAMIAGTPVTVYPGIDAAGDIKIWIYGGGVSEALQYDLGGISDAAAEGICATTPVSGDGALQRIAYWTGAASTLLQVGDLVETGGELAWTKTGEISADEPITACTFTGDTASVYSGPTIDAASLRRLGRQTLVTLSEEGDVDILFDTGETRRYDIIDGITVIAPEVPTAVAATGDARGGGYPGGLIVLGGDVAPDDHRVVLVDPSKITLTPINVPPMGE